MGYITKKSFFSGVVRFLPNPIICTFQIISCLRDFLGLAFEGDRGVFEENFCYLAAALFYLLLLIVDSSSLIFLSRSHSFEWRGQFSQLCRFCFLPERKNGATFWASAKSCTHIGETRAQHCRRFIRWRVSTQCLCMARFLPPPPRAVRSPILRLCLC